MNGYKSDNQLQIYNLDSNGVGTDKYGNKVTRIEIPKWADVSLMIKEQSTLHFPSEADLAQFLKQNPQYEINQRYPGTASVQLYVREYAETEINAFGIRVPKRWLTEEETQDYLASLEDKKTR